MKKLLRKLNKNLMSKGIFKKFNFHALILVLLLNVFHVVIAAAPSEPVTPTGENLMKISSLQVLSPLENHYRLVKRVTITAYSSTPDQTDETPYITAANTAVRDGIVASNFLPLYAKIRIPELFGDKIFVVEDRMHERFSDRIDIWLPERELARNFGLKRATIQIL